VSALTDSGSSVNIISEQLYNSLPYSKKSEFNSDVHDSIVLANNHKVEVVGTAMIKMNISGTNQRIFTYILKMSSHPIILGTNYLIENKLVLDFNELSAVPKTANVYCLKRTTVLPSSETIVWGKLPSNILFGKQGTCTSSKYILARGPLVSKSVVMVLRDRLVPIKLLNPTKDKIELYKGKTLATFSEITSEHILIPFNENSKHSVQNINLVPNTVENRR
jgi:hypothetical protein